MGEARKRRLALIKQGRPEVARTQYYPPSSLITQTFLSNYELDKAINERFERTRRDQMPTRADFLEKLVIAGLASFDRYEASQAVTSEPESLIAQPTDEQVVKLG